MGVERKTKALQGKQFNEIDFNELIQSGEPCILKGALHKAPLVQAALQSDEQAMSYLLSHVSERPLLNYTAGPEAKTRFFYNAEMNGLNFSTEYISLADFFQRLKQEKAAGTGACFYVGSAEVANHFPRLIESDDLLLKGDTFQKYPPRAGIWLGNRTTAAIHYDVSNNVAACLAGRRRFTLFPPDQIANLYPGPLEPTPGGQVVSMFDLNAPDFERFPKAKAALECAQVADLEAGDVLVYPAMWWHQVEALDDFNIMINYWWNTVDSYVDDPMSTLLHGLLSLRDRPDNEKQAWRSLFDYYVFGEPETPREHLPEHIWGELSPMDAMTARRLRAKLIKRFNR